MPFSIVFTHLPFAKHSVCVILLHTQLTLGDVCHCPTCDQRFTVVRLEPSFLRVPSRAHLNNGREIPMQSHSEITWLVCRWAHWRGVLLSFPSLEAHPWVRKQSSFTQCHKRSKRNPRAYITMPSATQSASFVLERAELSGSHKAVK